MGRELRVDYEAAWQHVMNRGGRCAATFIDDHDRRYFLDLVGQLEDRYGLEVHGYCLMENHYHLLLRSVDGRLSEGMQWLGSRYTRAFNRRHGFDGALFRGRFRSKLIESDQYLLAASRYVARNPLAIAGVSELSAYPWSSHGAQVGARKAPTWLHIDFVDRLYGAGQHNYVKFVETDLPVDASVVGRRAAPRPTPTSGADRRSTESSVGGEPEVVAPDLREIVDAATEVGHLASMSPTRSPGTTLRDARLCALILAKQRTQMSAETLARQFSYPSASAMKSAAARATRRLGEDSDLASLFEQIRRRAQASESLRTQLRIRDTAA